MDLCYGCISKLFSHLYSQLSMVVKPYLKRFENYTEQLSNLITVAIKTLINNNKIHVTHITPQDAVLMLNRFHM